MIAGRNYWNVVAEVDNAEYWRIHVHNAHAPC